MLLSFERWAPDMGWEIATGKSVLAGELTVYPRPQSRHRAESVPLHQLAIAPVDVSGHCLDSC